MADTTEFRRKALDEVANAVCRDRSADYGDAEDNFQNIANLWNIILQKKLSEELTAVDVANAMAQVKEARKISTPFHPDHYVDGAGYNICGVGIVDAQAHREAAGWGAEEPDEGLPDNWDDMMDMWRNDRPGRRADG